MTYVIESKVTGPVVTTAEAKDFMSFTSSLKDSLIDGLVLAATIQAEIKMNRDILETSWINFRDTFVSDLTLRRGGFVSLTSVEFLKDGSYVVLDAAKYVVSIGGAFGVIKEIEAPVITKRSNLVRIKFKTGFANTVGAVPEDIKTAIKFHVSSMFSMRGDCPSDKVTMPPVAAQIYRSHRLIDVSGSDCEDENVPFRATVT